MSVWVCLSSEFARDTYRAFKTRNACPACKGGVCGTDNKPCDAVEYAEVKRGNDEAKEWKRRYDSLLTRYLMRGRELVQLKKEVKP